MLPSWVAFVLFVIAAVLVIALLLREALFTDAAEASSERHEPHDAPARYDAQEPAHRTADRRRAA
jgi:hypothetical protein